MMANIDSPIPLSDIETVLAWVDTFKLSRPTKKINRDFSDAVLLAEILNQHYPKLVEMHNYPPRNSHSLKLNNWMTLNRKVLKKLKLTLCCNTMEQLANCAPGVIERVLVMVREKIRRDEELNRSMREAEQNMSSGGSYYEACGEEEHVLVVPLKTRVSGVLETVQQKVVTYDAYCIVKEELKDAKETNEMLKQKVEHLENLLTLKAERIEQLQTQLERKQSWRNKDHNVQDNQVLSNSLAVPFENPPSPKLEDAIIELKKAPSIKSTENNKIGDDSFKPSLTSLTKTDSKSKVEESKIPVLKDSLRSISKPSSIEAFKVESNETIGRVQSDLFREVLNNKSDIFQDVEEFKDPIVTTIEDTIQNEIKNISDSKAIDQDVKQLADALAFSQMSVDKNMNNVIIISPN